MKRKDLQELRNQNIEELTKLAQKKDLEIAKLNLELKAGRERNIRLLKAAKKDLARIKTLIAEKKILEILEKEKK